MKSKKIVIRHLGSVQLLKGAKFDWPMQNAEMRTIKSFQKCCFTVIFLHDAPACCLSKAIR